MNYRVNNEGDATDELEWSIVEGDDDCASCHRRAHASKSGALRCLSRTLQRLGRKYGRKSADLRAEADELDQAAAERRPYATPAIEEHGRLDPSELGLGGEERSPHVRRPGGST
jgi:hypothetical protein